MIAPPSLVRLSSKAEREKTQLEFGNRGEIATPTPSSAPSTEGQAKLPFHRRNPLSCVPAIANRGSFGCTAPA